MAAPVKIVGYFRDNQRSRDTAPRPRVRAAVILAGGGGRRRAPPVGREHVSGPPNQPSASRLALRLARTFRLVERLIPPDRIITVVDRESLDHPDVRGMLAGRPRDTVLVQPETRDTAPELLLSLMVVRRRYGQAIVAAFPLPHAVGEDEGLIASVDLAFGHLERHPESMVVLGVEPERPECRYGYLVPGEPIGGSDPTCLYRVSRFVEQPSRRVAVQLIRQGALRSTSILVCRPEVLFDFMWRTAPVLPAVLTDVAEAIGTPSEREIITKAYHELPPVNLSRGVLELLASERASHLLVLRVERSSSSRWLGRLGGLLVALRQRRRPALGRGFVDSGSGDF